jgi:hypothetical protein
MSRRKHHEPHDALAIDLFAVLLNVDFRLEPVRNLHELSGRPGMDAQLVEDGEIFFDHEESGYRRANSRGPFAAIQGKIHSAGTFRLIPPNIRSMIPAKSCAPGTTGSSPQAAKA